MLNEFFNGSLAGSGGPGLYVEDVFSTYLHAGTGAAKTIVNGIDLAGEGGMTWIKNRTGTNDHVIYDTERGVTLKVAANTTSAESTFTGGLTAFNSDGFDLGTHGTGNSSSNDYASWSFRKAPGFFDVVTYTGDKVVGRTVAHNLGSVPGMIIIKGVSGSSGVGDWFVYHRSVGATGALRLNKTDTETTSSVFWNNTEPTSTHFTLGSSNGVNNTGTTYVAYIFAHDDQSFGANGNEAVIKCGSYTGNGNANGPTIDLGFEPQWLLIKQTDIARNWNLFDSMRGIDISDASKLSPNLNSAETSSDWVQLTASGFEVTSNNVNVNQSGGTYIYVAIRRPHKPPTAGTDVFDIANDTESQPEFTFPPDTMWVLDRQASSGDYPWVATRLLGANRFGLCEASAMQSDTSFSSPSMNGENNTYGTSWSSSRYLPYGLKRAPGFLDIVTYTGNATAGRTVSHNLGAAPQMIITRNTASNTGSFVYHEGIGAPNILPEHCALELYAGNSYINNPAYWNDTAPTATDFTVGTSVGTNGNGALMVAYLFGTVPGVSKVGFYTGTGSALDIDCGFTNGARFVLIRRWNGDGDWHLWDSYRGINAGTEPYSLINTYAAETTVLDRLDPLSTGFTVPPSATLNSVSTKCIYLAIA